MPDTRLTTAEVERIAKAMSERAAMSDDDIRSMALAAGVIKEAMYDVLVRFPNDGSESFSTFIKRLKPDTPHWYPPAEPGSDLDAAQIEAACGQKPTLAARAVLFKAAGPENYAKILAAWGCSPNDLKPGTNPKREFAPEKPAADGVKRVSPDNPWGDAYVTKHGQDAAYAERGRLMKVLGLKPCAAMAAAAGKTVTGVALTRSN